jgi:hypothetical protein
MLATSWGRWVIGTLVVLALVALLAWARRDPGFDERIPDPEDAAVVVTGGGVPDGADHAR